MHVENMVIQNFEWVEDEILSFEIQSTDELVDLADEIRELNGCTDRASSNDNDVWYNFTLNVNVVQEKVILWFTCNNGDKDDYANYDIEITDEEKIKFVWKAFRQFAKEMDSEVDF